MGKQYKREQDQIAHMKDYIARFGHGSAKLARQAQSKEKTLAKMVAGGLTEKVSSDKTVSSHFPLSWCKTSASVTATQLLGFTVISNSALIWTRVWLWWDPTEPANRPCSN